MMGIVQGDSDNNGYLDISRGGMNAGTALEARENLGLGKTDTVEHGAFLSKDYPVIDVTHSDFSADRTGVSDSLPAFQAAVTRATEIIGSMTSFGNTGVGILVPPGYYSLSSQVLVAQSGITFFSYGRGAVIAGDSILFDIGDYTDVYAVRQCGLHNLTLFSTNTANATAALKLYKTARFSASGLSIVNFSIGIDSVKSGQSILSNLYIRNWNRTENAAAFIRLQGSSELAAYAPGGGMDLSHSEFYGDCEVNGTETTYTESGILVNAVDGLYINVLHMRGYRYGLDVNPEANEANNVITGIKWVHGYLDEPSQLATAPRCVNLRGSVKETITYTGTSDTRSSRYGNIELSDVYMRGNLQADKCFAMQVTDAGGWVAAGNKIDNIKINGGFIKQATGTGLYIYGASSSNVEPDGFSVHGVYFGDNNTANDPGIQASAIAAQFGGISIKDCIFGPDRYAAPRAIQAITSALGSDVANPSLLIDGNDFSKSNATEALSYTNTTGAKIVISNNIPIGGAHQYEDQCYTLTTTDATTTNLYSFTIPEGAAGVCRLELSGSNADGSKAVAYIFEAGYRRNTSASSLSTGTSDFDPVKAWNPDSLATPPTATLDVSHRLRLNVTGVAATTITWVARVQRSQSK